MRRLKLLPAWPLRVAAALALVLALIGATGASTTTLPTIQPLAPNIVMVSDSVAKKVYFYKAPEMTLTGQLDVDLGSVHGGITTLPVLQFPGGRVILADVPNQQISSFISTPRVRSRTSTRAGGSRR